MSSFLESKQDYTVSATVRSGYLIHGAHWHSHAGKRAVRSGGQPKALVAVEPSCNVCKALAAVRSPRVPSGKLRFFAPTVLQAWAQARLMCLAPVCSMLPVVMQQRGRGFKGLLETAGANLSWALVVPCAHALGTDYCRGYRQTVGPCIHDLALRTHTTCTAGCLRGLAMLT